MATATTRSDAGYEVEMDGYGPRGRPEWLDVDWRPHLRWERVRGRNVNLLEIGEGPPLVFVHGHSGSWTNWLEQLPRFARTHRCTVRTGPTRP